MRAHHGRFPAAMLLAAMLAACGDTGQRERRYPAVAMGGPRAPFAVGAWTVTLEVARLGFGPVYFCATEGASADLCPAAVAELTTSTTIDLLAGAAVPLGEVNGVTGAIRSATYDYAWSWPRTSTTAAATTGAPGGRSAHFEGRATRGDVTIRFVADVDVVPTFQGTRAVQGQRVHADVDDTITGLEIAFSPRAWMTQVPFDDVAARATADGAPVVIARGTAAHNALVLAMTALAPPTFQWTTR